MKKIIIILLLTLLPLTASADFTVYFDKTTKGVEFAGDEKNILLSDTDKGRLNKIIKPGKLEDYALTESLYDYKIKNKNFVINTKKISDRENKKIDDENKNNKKNSDFQSAKTKLIGLGLTADEVNSLK